MPLATGTDGPCRVLALSQDNAWILDFKSLARRLNFRVKRLDCAVNMLMSFQEFDPHILLLDDFEHQEISLIDLCDALRVPRVLRPLAVLATTRVPIPAGEDLGELGIDEILNTDLSPEHYSTSLVQHFRLAVSQRKVFDRERDILDSLPDALIVVDTQLTLWKANRAFAALYGMEHPEPLRRNLGQPLLPALARALGAEEQRRPGQTLAAELQTALRNQNAAFQYQEILGGSERFIAGQITRLEATDGHVLVALRDVTDHEQNLLREARRERLATIGNLSVGVAHEIQNPNTFSRVNAANLKALLSALKPLLLQIPDIENRKAGSLTVPAILEKIETAVAGIEKAAQRIGAVLDTLKSFCKSDTDTIGAVALPEAVAEAALLTKHVVGSRIDLAVDLPDKLPPVRAGATGLVQVLVNLIENACNAFDFPEPHARGEGRPQIRISVSRLDPDELEIALADNGPGIDKAIQAQIFRPYFTTRAQGEGTGLGLSLSLDIAHRYGGDLRVRSRRGQGATFLITLKRADADAASGRG